MWNCCEVHLGPCWSSYVTSDWLEISSSVSLLLFGAETSMNRAGHEIRLFRNLPALQIDDGVFWIWNFGHVVLITTTSEENGGNSFLVECLVTFGVGQTNDGAHKNVWHERHLRPNMRYSLGTEWMLSPNQTWDLRLIYMEKRGPRSLSTVSGGGDWLFSSEIASAYKARRRMVWIRGDGWRSFDNVINLNFFLRKSNFKIVLNWTISNQKAKLEVRVMLVVRQNHCSVEYCHSRVMFRRCRSQKKLSTKFMLSVYCSSLSNLAKYSWSCFFLP